MSYPIVEGIVCFQKDVDVLLNAVHAVQEGIAAAKAKKKEARALKNWKVMVSMLLNRQKLFDEYL
jgi:hypothetical protein